MEVKNTKQYQEYNSIFYLLQSKVNLKKCFISQTADINIQEALNPHTNTKSENMAQKCFNKKVVEKILIICSTTFLLDFRY